MRKNRILSILCVLTVCFSLLTGCSAELKAFLWDIFLQWSADHAGELIAYGVTGSSGNEEVDAVMGVKSVVSNIAEADKLMEEGRKNSDTSKMEEAIKKRPGDYTYRVSYGAELLAQGDAESAAVQFDAADQLAASYGPSHTERYASQGIAEIENSGTGAGQAGFANRDHCQLYWARLEYYYRLRNSVTPSATDLERANHAQTEGQNCSN